MTLYQVLGVPPSIPQRELKTIYRRLAKATHPDRNPDDLEAHERFKRISEAWAVLGDVDKRALYDLDLAEELSRQAGRPLRAPSRRRPRQPAPPTEAEQATSHLREQVRGWSQEARTREAQRRQQEIEAAIRTADEMRERALKREAEAREKAAAELEEKLRKLRES